MSVNAPLLDVSIQDEHGRDTAKEGEAHERSGTVSGAVFNLSNSILGGGISLLALPSAVDQAGPIFFLILLLVSGVATVTSAQLLADAAEIAGARSYDGLGAEVLGHWGKIAVVFFILLNNLGVCITFLCGFGDVIPEIIKTARGGGNTSNASNTSTMSLGGADASFGPILGAAANSTTPFYESRSGLIMLLVLPLLPIMLSITRIERLQSLSLAALVLDMLFVGFVVVLFGEYGAEAGSAHYWSQGPKSAEGALNAIAIISLSFTCHFNIIPILIGLKRPKAITSVIVWSTVANTILYAAVGLIAFFAHPTHLTGDILDDYAGFKGADVLQVFVVVAMVITFPLLGFEGQHAFQVLVLGGGCAATDSSGSGNTKPPFLTPHRKHVVACTVYTLAAITVAAAVSNTSAMIALVGAACGIPIMYILPPLLYLKAAALEIKATDLATSNDSAAATALNSAGLRKAKRSGVRKGALVLLVLGVLVCIACIVSSILGF